MVAAFPAGRHRAAGVPAETSSSPALQRYAADRNDPRPDCVSRMSPYLHFGQISPLEIALAVLRAGRAPEATDAFLEELIVRRELAMNFVHYNAHYDCV